MDKIEISDENALDMILVVAMFRCFNEQLYTLKGVHKKVLKQRFNRLCNVASLYEKQIVKTLGDDVGYDKVYDELMDVILEIKEQFVVVNKNPSK
jgi:hypothetical protein